MTKFERLFVWSGGALFVASLATTAWWYIWRLGREAAALDRLHASALALDAAVFSVFALHHSLFARTPLKRWLARLAPERLLRSIYVWIASLLLVAMCLLWQPIGGILYTASGAPAALLALAQLAGVVLIARSVGAIDPLELAGIRPRGSADGDVPSLQITGPYHFVRHPLYLGWMLIVFAPATLTADRLSFAAISSLYLLVAIPWEEGSLEAVFGESYVRYKQHVPWRVIPFVY